MLSAEQVSQASLRRALSVDSAEWPGVAATIGRTIDACRWLLRG
jgi:hypothetical protein